MPIPSPSSRKVYGQRLDVTAVKEQILEMVSTLQSGEILLETTPIAPTVTVAELEKNVELRYRATTAISKNSTEDRTNNIRVAFERINGTILQGQQDLLLQQLPSVAVRPETATIPPSNMPTAARSWASAAASVRPAPPSIWRPFRPG